MYPNGVVVLNFCVDFVTFETGSPIAMSLQQARMDQHGHPAHVIHGISIIQTAVPEKEPCRKLMSMNRNEGGNKYGSKEGPHEKETKS